MVESEHLSTQRILDKETEQPIGRCEARPGSTDPDPQLQLPSQLGVLIGAAGDVAYFAAMVSFGDP
jgi:hypothetical protein